jgi:bifunctional oligoribonuclease and PAP phosphatase NrnA
MPPITATDLAAARNRLAAANRLLLITHVAPDGDAIGSVLGMGLALRAAGKTVVFACADALPDVFRFLPASNELTANPQGSFDCVVVLDVSDPARMGSVGAQLDRTPDIVFDHHLTNPGFGHLNFIDVQAASTAELLTELLPALSLPLTADVAQCLLTGLVNDTLGFRTSNTTPKTLALAQTLMLAGGVLHQVYDLSMFKRSYTAVRLWAEGLGRMQMKHRIVWAKLPLEARQASNFQGTGDADLINVLTSVREADIALIFVERTDGKVKISWRSVAGINVAGVAAQFGGGGHAQAAGAEVAGSMEEVEARVLAATRLILKPAAVPAAPPVA